MFEERGLVSKISPQRAAMSFLVMTCSCIILTFVARALWDIIQIDILQNNPHRTILHALTVLPAMAVIVGIFIIVGCYVLALIVSGGIVALSKLRLGFVPAWVLLLIVLVSAVSVVIQDRLIPDLTFYTDPPDPISRWHKEGILIVHLTLGLVGGWLISRSRGSA